jgi:SAM-dependent methyltransferase
MDIPHVEAWQPGSNDYGPAEAPNYAYWAKNGGDWYDEYESRKRTILYFHLQEAMITDYVARLRPERVLEFGCGVGRHLRNLCRIPHIDVQGFDQSPTMVAGMLRWTDRDWIDSHVRVGPPVGTLPYADGAFDLVFTSEVLVHVRPEHLDGVLRELMRVCRGHVLHIEPSEQMPIVADAHGGCWNHDLQLAYLRLGKNSELLPAGYFSQAPVRVPVRETPLSDAWPSPTLSVYRQMERMLAPTLAAEATSAARVEGLELALREKQTEASETELRLQNERVSSAAELDAMREGFELALQQKQMEASQAELRFEKERVSLSAELNAMREQLERSEERLTRTLLSVQQFEVLNSRIPGLEQQLRRRTQDHAYTLMDFDDYKKDAATRIADHQAKIGDLETRLGESFGQTQAFQLALEYVRSRYLYRVGVLLRRWGVWNLLRWTLTRNRHVAVVEVLGQDNRERLGRKVILLQVAPSPGGRPMYWDFAEWGRGWELEESTQGAFGRALVGWQGRLRCPGGPDPEFTFLAHREGGAVRVTWRGRTKIVDLLASDPVLVTVRPNHIR